MYVHFRCVQLKYILEMMNVKSNVECILCASKIDSVKLIKEKTFTHVYMSCEMK